MSEVPNIGPEPIPACIEHLDFSIPTKSDEVPMRTPHCGVCGHHAVLFATIQEAASLDLAMAVLDEPEAIVAAAFPGRGPVFHRLMLDGTHEHCALVSGC